MQTPRSFWSSVATCEWAGLDSISPSHIGIYGRNTGGGMDGKAAEDGSRGEGTVPRWPPTAGLQAVVSWQAPHGPSGYPAAGPGLDTTRRGPACPIDAGAAALREGNGARSHLGSRSVRYPISSPAARLPLRDPGSNPPGNPSAWMSATDGGASPASWTRSAESSPL